MLLEARLEGHEHSQRLHTAGEAQRHQLVASLEESMRLSQLLERTHGTREPTTSLQGAAAVTDPLDALHQLIAMQGSSDSSSESPDGSSAVGSGRLGGNAVARSRSPSPWRR